MGAYQMVHSRFIIAASGTCTMSEGQRNGDGVRTANLSRNRNFILLGE
jgi:hypothetical protein